MALIVFQKQTVLAPERNGKGEKLGLCFCAFKQNKYYNHITDFIIATIAKKYTKIHLNENISSIIDAKNFHVI